MSPLLSPTASRNRAKSGVSGDWMSLGIGVHWQQRRISLRIPDALWCVLDRIKNVLGRIGLLIRDVADLFMAPTAEPRQNNAPTHPRPGLQGHRGRSLLDGLGSGREAGYGTYEGDRKPCRPYYEDFGTYGSNVDRSYRRPNLSPIAEDRYRRDLDEDYDYLNDPDMEIRYGDAGVVELARRGYQHLAKELAEKKNPLRLHLQQLDSPALMDQIRILNQSLQHQVGTYTGEALEKILAFGIELAEDGALQKECPLSPLLPNLSFTPIPGVKRLEELLGKMIFLAERHPKQLIDAINLDDRPNTLDRISKLYHDEVSELSNRVLDHYADHQKTLMQEPDRAFNTLLPIEIAHTLITNNGEINYGLIPDLMERFVSSEEPKLNHQINLWYALGLLQKSPKLREKFDAIVKPSSASNPANALIRTVLGMAPDEPVRDVDAKKVALAGILSHLRQGKVGSCFATFLAIQILSDHLGQAIDDFASLLEFGLLRRKVDQAVVDFPFILKVSSDNIDSSVNIDENGKIQHATRQTGYLWESPGLKAATRMLGIEDCKGVLRRVVENLFADQKDVKVLEVSPLSLLSQICKDMAEAGIGEERDLLNSSIFAFETQTSSGLLRVWENCIAGMAEADLNGFVKRKMHSSLIDSIRGQFSDLSDFNEEDQEKFLEAFKEQVAQRVELHYDPAVPHQEKSDDGHSTEGAYVMYDSMHSSNHIRWKRVDNPSTYQEISSDMADRAWKAIFRNMSKEDRDRLEKPRRELDDFIQSPDYVYVALSHYHLMNILVDDPMEDYITLEHTPWVDKTGNNTVRTLQVYLEMERPPESDRVQAKNGEELLSYIIDFARSAPEETKQHLVDNPYKLVPVRTPGRHAFSLMLGHPKLAQAWKQHYDTRTWIQRYVENPGLEVADSTIPESTAERVIQYCEKYVVSSGNAQVFRNRAEALDEFLSVSEWRDEILDLIREIEGKNLKQANRLERRVDSRIADYLSPVLKDKLSQSAIHFADSNWRKSINDLHFVFLVNPGSRKLEIWELRDSGNDYWALDQREWLTEQKWEFFTNYNLIPKEDFLDIA